MDIVAKRSLPGLIQVWSTIVFPPALILVYLIYINFDVSVIETAYWVIGAILLFTSVVYLFLFGKTLFLPKDVVTSRDGKFFIHKRSHHEESVSLHDIVDVSAIKNSRMSFLRLNPAQRSYGKLIIKTLDKTYDLFPIANVDDAKNNIENKSKEFKKDYE